MLYLLAFIFILGAAVIIHEFGHFIVAKLLGIRVETFSVGFGRRLFGKKIGTTDYRVSLIPLGGYVKLGGDESNAGLEEGSSEPDIPLKERFDLRPRWQKFLVAVAGPVMNILTAIAIPMGGAMLVGAPVMPPPVVKTVQQGGAGEAAGLRPGDRIVAFNNREGSEWVKIRNDAMLSPDQPIPLVYERDGQRVSTTITPTRDVIEGESYGKLGLIPDYGELPIAIVQVQNESPAAEAGLQPGDRLLTIGGEPVRSSEHVIEYIRSNAQQAIPMRIERGGQVIEVSPTPRMIEGQMRLGMVPSEVPPLKKLGLTSAVSYAVGDNIEMLRVTWMALGQVFSNQRSMRDTFAGPIGIAVASKRAVEEGGLEGGLRMLGFLSLNLGIFNLLPIPVLDGGMIFMLILEGLLGLVGLTLSLRVRERIQQVGFVFLLLLMGFVIFNDISKLASRLTGANDAPAATERQK